MLSLDPILGYHIKPDVYFHEQPNIVRVSVGFVSVILVLGLANGIFSIMSFGAKRSRDVGCGRYLLVSSVLSTATALFLCIKLCTLILSQTQSITNRTYLNLSCLMTDGILKACLASSEWLNSCVAIERALTVLQGVRFDQRKSRQQARILVSLVPLLVVLTYLHDPFHRELVDDAGIDGQRTWCFIRYPPSLDIYNNAVNFIHLLFPLSINLISGSIIVIQITRNRRQTTKRQQLLHQLQQHKHLLIAPCILVLVGLPRLIIPFISGCMKDPQGSGLFLTGYLVPFVSTILTFLIYALPSQRYRHQFNLSFRTTIHTIRRNIPSMDHK
jgi:uncharacterized membrane protein